MHDTTTPHQYDEDHSNAMLFAQPSRLMPRAAAATECPQVLLTERTSKTTSHFKITYFCAMKLLIAVLFITLTSATVWRSNAHSAVASQSEAHIVLCDTLNPQGGQTTGDVQVVVDSSITKLEKSLRGFRDIKGYRVQIYLGTADAVKTERNKYLGLGLPYSAYMKQVVPEYSLVIGDFATRMELEKHLQIIQQHYPKAFAISDVIEVKSRK